jgi:hypothetical protein
MSQFATSADSLSRSLSQQEESDEAPKLTFAEPHPSWSPVGFAREQARGLVRQLFFCGNEKHARHVLFSTIDRETDIDSIALLVGETLALEKVGSVAVSLGCPKISRGDSASLGVTGERRPEMTPLRQSGLRLQENLWVMRSAIEDPASVAPNLHGSLCDLRREFDYSILAAAAADSPEALATLQMVDGVVLVISARHTRRATARSVKRVLESANARILGTVLMDRVFPIPANIYRRL